MAGSVLTCAEIAERLKCSKSQVSKLIHGKVKGAPRLKVVHLGRRPLVREESLEEWFRKSEKCNADR
jgi:excisionase family DNA binding protein